MGEAFAIGAVIMDKETGEVEKHFLARCPIDALTEKVNEWVEENVLPQMEDVPQTHEGYAEILEAFMDWYMQNKTDADVIVHMGFPVETKLIRDAHTMGIIGDWDAPYPLIDIAAFPQIGDSVDTYNKENGIEIPTFDGAGGTHNPLYDSIAAAAAYRDILKHM